MGVLHDAFLTNVRTRLELLSWNQNRLAEELGMSRSMVSAYLRARSKPGLALVHKFSVALQCGDPADLLRPNPKQKGDDGMVATCISRKMR